MLNHFLGGSGKSVTYSQKFLKQDQNYNDALAKNRSRINLQMNEKALALAVGQSVSYNDYWDAQFTSSYGSELYYASGTPTITTNVSMKITRTSLFTYQSQGTITNSWHDFYNWEPGATAYIPRVGFVPDDFGLSLDEAGRARSFKMHSTEKVKIAEKNFIVP